LHDYKQVILDYYNQKCGNNNYEESLKQESAVLSQIVDQNVVNAWLDCMTHERTGLFVSYKSNYLEKSAEHTLTLKWKSAESSKVTRLYLTYQHRYLLAGQESVEINESFSKTVNICAGDVCGPMLSGGTLSIPFSHTDTRYGAQITVNAQTETGFSVSEVINLPPPPAKYDIWDFLIRNRMDHPMTIRLAKRNKLTPFLENQNGKLVVAEYRALCGQ
jgi:hypothetical protein